jgi:hypothetical protein
MCLLLRSLERRRPTSSWPSATGPPTSTTHTKHTLSTFHLDTSRLGRTCKCARAFPRWEQEDARWKRRLDESATTPKPSAHQTQVHTNTRPPTQDHTTQDHTNHPKATRRQRHHAQPDTRQMQDDRCKNADAKTDASPHIQMQDDTCNTAHATPIDTHSLIS